VKGEVNGKMLAVKIGS